jgi:hypothetical protein
MRRELFVRIVIDIDRRKRYNCFANRLIDINFSYLNHLLSDIGLISGLSPPVQRKRGADSHIRQGIFVVAPFLRFF